jgi:hypothetical protein
MFRVGPTPRPAYRKASNRLAGFLPSGKWRSPYSEIALIPIPFWQEGATAKIKLMVRIASKLQIRQRDVALVGVEHCHFRLLRLARGRDYTLATLGLSTQMAILCQQARPAKSWVHVAASDKAGREDAVAIQSILHYVTCCFLDRVSQIRFFKVLISLGQ